MKLIRNTLVFLETSFFKEYKLSDASYRKLFQYSIDGKIAFCTSYFCLEEWRTQKVSHISNTLNDLSGKFKYLHKTNYIASRLLDSEMYNNFPDTDQTKSRSKDIAKEFFKENNIRLYLPKENHIWSTWEAYFHGQAPFKTIKNRKDIPDAWILECARDALLDERNINTGNKFIIGEDKYLCGSFNAIGFETITVLDLVERLEKEEAGIIPNFDTAIMESTQETEDDTVTTEGLSPLDALLTKALDASLREINLRLLGFVVALDTPSHEALIDAVVSKGFDRKLTEASAVILSKKSKPYIKDTGNHYVVENKEICTAAAERLTQEIIEMLG